MHELILSGLHLRSYHLVPTPGAVSSLFFSWGLGLPGSLKEGRSHSEASINWKHEQLPDVLTGPLSK